MRRSTKEVKGQGDMRSAQGDRLHKVVTVAFNGSPNATNSSQVNGELVWKVTDARVAVDTCKEAWAEAVGVGPL